MQCEKGENGVHLKQYFAFGQMGLGVVGLNRKEVIQMNSGSKEDFTDTWWFLGICATVTFVLTIFAL
ncbi:hypothetical protein ACIQXI_16725 [Lysinibacillus sp. NPDC097195]|uniref:hypothetical protein n=1 Tax=Lysinibacillus sp. NPDC097195 TaxID=3364141 RepID=UPI003817FAC3